MSAIGRLVLVVSALSAIATPVAAATTGETFSAILRPESDFSKVCKTSRPAMQDPRDWTQWQGEPIDSGVMLNAARRLISGGLDGRTDAPTARRLLDHLVNGRSAVAAEAEIVLAKLLLDPEAGLLDQERAVALLRSSARSGETNALLELARLHERGEAVEKSAEAAAALYRRAFLGGSATAAFQLVRLYGEGEVKPPAPDISERLATSGFAMFANELALGDCATLRRISQALGDENSPLYNPALARRWLEAGVRVRDPEAIVSLGEMFLDENGDARDLARILEALDAIPPSIGAAKLRVAILLRRGGPNDYEAALRVLGPRVGAGDPQAISLSASILSGAFGGLPHLDRKRLLLQQAANLPDPHPDLVADLAVMVRIGLGGPADPAEAERLVARAAELGHPGSLQIFAGRGHEDALDELRRQASLQVVEAQRSLASLHLCGLGVPMDRIKARELLEAAAPRDPISARMLGNEPRLVPTEPERQQYLELAANSGDRLAMVDLATLLLSHRSVPDTETATHWEETALRPGAGQPKAAAYLAALQLSQSDAGPDRDQALAGLKALADLGEPVAATKLGRALLKSGAVQDGVTLLRYAAEQGQPEAMLALGTMEGPPAGIDQMATLTRAMDAGEGKARIQLVALANGREDAQALLATLNDGGVCRAADMVGVARVLADNKTKAFDAQAASELFARAEAIGAGDPEAEFALGLAARDSVYGQVSDARIRLQAAYEAGHPSAALELGRMLVGGGEPALKDAVAWYGKAYDRGRRSAPVELIRTLTNGEAAGSKPFTTAVELLQRAADDGRADAMRQLALIYERGQGVAMDTDRSRDLLRRAADAGNTAAMRDLASVYSAGLGVPMSLSESTKWLKRAAENGDVKAMRELASALRVGLGVDKDLAAADRWLAASKSASVRSTQP